MVWFQIEDENDPSPASDVINDTDPFSFEEGSEVEIGSAKTFKCKIARRGCHVHLDIDQKKSQAILWIFSGITAR